MPRPPFACLEVVETELLERIGGIEDNVLELELAATLDMVESCVLNRSTGRTPLLPCKAFRAIVENAPLASSMPALKRFRDCPSLELSPELSVCIKE
jgi:hypothetical protein